MNSPANENLVATLVNFLKKTERRIDIPANSYRLIAGICYYFLVITLISNFAASSIILAKDKDTFVLEMPGKVVVEEDDNNAILSWGDPIQPDRPNPAGVTGYRISWGLANSSAAPTVQLTSERAIQLQPLVNGQTYQATVQAVDSLGNLSAPSQSVSFIGNPNRVNALRQRMSGFFDDFNQPAGALDELKWNQAFSACDNAEMTASFINSQFHAHNMVLSTCDRAQVINRPRATFDFTDRTGTVAFDLDGAVSRTFWYLDFIDAANGPVDITSHIDPSDAGQGYPGNILRVRQSNNGLDLALVDGNGKESTLARQDWSPYAPLDWVGYTTIPNLRRHWEIHLSQQKVEISIDGKPVLASNLALSFSKSILHWNLFSYNTAKNNVPYALIHWDNFGFDGPAPAVVTHNYRTAGYGGRDLLKAQNEEPTNVKINIPDPVAGATAQRLMFTLQRSDYSTYNWSANDKVLINDVPVQISQPSSMAGNIDSIRPYPVSLALPAGILKTGSNQVSFVTKDSHILNIHVELDFPKGGIVPPFTQPVNIYPEHSAHAMPVMPEVGPAVFIQKIGEASASDGGRYTTRSIPVSGTVPVSFDINNGPAMSATGKNPGISKVQLRINKSVVQEWNFTNPVPATSLSYNLDSARYANGMYELDVVAFNQGGAISIPNYFEAHAKAGDYYPFQLNISNSQPGQIVVPLPVTEVVSTPTAQPVPPTVTLAPPLTNPPTAIASQSNALKEPVLAKAERITDYSITILIILASFCYLLIGEVVRLRKGIKQPSKLRSILVVMFWPLQLFRK